MASDIYAGTVADMWAFENKEGTFSDLARDLGIENQATQFLSGELSDNEFEASLKAGMEGAMIGGAFYGVAKVYRILRDGFKQYGTGRPVVSGSPQAQRGSVGLETPRILPPAQQAATPVRPMRANLTKAEQAYFDEVFGSEPDLRELQEYVPGIELTPDGLTVPNNETLGRLADYIEETVMLEAGQGRRLPPSFNNASFWKKFARVEDNAA